jgi:hypothetical protein
MFDVFHSNPRILVSSRMAAPYHSDILISGVPHGGRSRIHYSLLRSGIGPFILETFM